MQFCTKSCHAFGIFELLTSGIGIIRKTRKILTRQKRKVDAIFVQVQSTRQWIHCTSCKPNCAFWHLLLHWTSDLSNQRSIKPTIHLTSDPSNHRTFKPESDVWTRVKWAGRLNYTLFAWVDLDKDRYKRQLAHMLNSDGYVSIECAEILELLASGESAWHGKQRQVMSAPGHRASG